MRLRAVGAHPDDIEYYCGGSMAGDAEVMSRFRGIRCGVRYAEGFRSLASHAIGNAVRFLP